MAAPLFLTLVKAWIRQLAGALLVIVFAAGVGGLLLLARAQQSGVGAAMAAAGIRSVAPPDGATDVPLSGDFRADYLTHPAQDPAIKVEPPVGVTLSNGHWEGTVFVMHYEGLRDDSQYHVELDQDQPGQKGEHKQVKVRWAFRTGAPTTASNSASPQPQITPTSTPTATLSATPVPGTRPSGLIWYHGPDSLIHAVDWTGRQDRSMQAGNAAQSPDGSHLWNRFPNPQAVAPPGTVTNDVGVTVGSVPGYQQMMWADDGAQFCAITASPAGTSELDIISLNGQRRTVGTIALPSTPAQSPALVACSDQSQQAVVAGEGSGYFWSLSLLSLRDGSVIYERRYPNPVARLVASHDGQYLAEQLPSNTSSPPFTFIRQLPSGTQLATVRGIVVEAFSWDGSLVAGPITGNPSMPDVQVIRWQTQQVVWRTCLCPTTSTVHVLPQPGGSKLAIIFGASFTTIDNNGSASTVAVGSTPITPAF